MPSLNYFMKETDMYRSLFIQCHVDITEVIGPTKSNDWNKKEIFIPPIF